MIKNKILTYHSIGNEGSGEIGSELYCVSESEFRAQVAYLAKNNALRRMKDDRFAKTKDELVHRASSLVLHNTILTFDDGLLNNYTVAYPILRKLGLTAYFFILVGKIGKNGYMNWQQIKELKDAGMIIGSHGITHRILTTLSSKDLDYELRSSKKALEENLGCVIDCLSIPRGFDNKKIMNAAKEAGYKTIFTSDDRISIKADWGLKKFVSVLNNGYSLKDKSIALAKNVSKRLLGARGYDSLRTRILGCR